jgi:heme o synthase
MVNTPETTKVGSLVGELSAGKRPGARLAALGAYEARVPAVDGRCLAPSTLNPRPSASVALQPAPAASLASWVAIYADLFKARLTFLVLLTTLVGFYIGWRGPVNYLLLFHTILGTALVASGASALNQLWERKFDALMRRTRERPLPSGRLQPHTALRVGCVAAVLGLTWLALAVNPLTSLLGACSLLAYLFLYTPLKRVTWLNTAVGAIPGGLPPLMGWAAARGQLNIEGWTLFAILALWQLPHFMAIAWIYRDEYARAGFKMLPVFDPEGRRTSRHAVAYTLALPPVSLCPFLLHLAGPVYLAGALALGLAFLGCAVHFARRLTVSSARQLFYASLLYLPLLLAVMVMDKLK